MSQALMRLVAQIEGVDMFAGGQGGRFRRGRSAQPQQA